MDDVVGKAWYELGARDQQLDRDLKEAEAGVATSGKKAAGAYGEEWKKSTDGIRANLGRVKTALAALGIGLGLSAVMGFFGGAIGAASDLNEEVSKSEVVFGGAADEVQQFAADADRALGQSEQQALAAAGGFGNMLRTNGLSEDAAASMSMRMVTLASDMASFNNQDPSEMLERLRSGLSGEAEPLRQFGVLISEARVQQEAWTSGLVETGVALTEQEKVQARYQLILKDTALQQGDFARTSEGLANSQRIQAAVWENSLADMGQALLPLAQEITKFATDVLPGMADSLTVALKVAEPFLSLILELAKSMLEAGTVIVPALALALGIKLVASLRAVTAGAQASSLALGPKGLLGVLGLLALQAGKSALEGLGEAVQNIIHGEETAQRIRTLTEEVSALGPMASAVAGKLEELGVTSEDLALAVAAAEGDVERAVQSLVGNNGDLADSLVDIANAIGEASPAMTEEWASAWRDMEVTTTKGGRLVSTAVKEVTDEIPEATAEARRQAVIEAFKVPGDIADAILAGKDELRPIRDLIDDIISGSVSDAAVKAKNTALLVNPNITEALTGNSTEAKAAMLTQVVEPMLASLDALPKVALATGRGVTGNLKDVLDQRGPEVVQAMRDLVEDQDATLAELAVAAEQRGLDGVASLIRGMIAKKSDAEKAGREVAGAAKDKMAFDAYAGGAASAQTFINGLIGTLTSWDTATRLQNAMQLAKTQGGFGSSMPKVGPFTAENLHRSTRSIAAFFTGDLSRELRRNRIDMRGALPVGRGMTPAQTMGVLAPAMAGAGPGAAGSFAMPPPPAGGPTTIYQLHAHGREPVIETARDAVDLMQRMRVLER